MKKDKVDMAFVNEEIQKENAIARKRTENDLTNKEVQLFKKMYSMNSNKDLAKQFLIEEEAVVKLAGKLKLYKDGAFTEYRKGKTIERRALTDKEGMKKAPGYLINSATKQMTDEEKREILNLYEDGLDPVEILDELIVAQMSRVSRGLEIEVTEDTLFTRLNDAVDTMHSMLKTAHELKHGKKLTFSLDEAILRSQGKEV